MKKNSMRYAAMLCSTAMMLTPAIGCLAEEPQDDQQVTVQEQEDPANLAMADFSALLLKECFQEGESTMVSPVSVMAALAMLGNGAEGETLAQMEAVFGMDMDELNTYLQSYLSSLTEDENCRWNAGNSIWINKEYGGGIKEEFLDANSGYHGAEIRSIPFDQEALDAINQWVSEQTDGMIGSILDRISAEEVMYLVNAIAFQGEWETPYEDYQVEDGTFTGADGKQEDISLMYSQEGDYLSDGQAAGFLKYYNGGRYAFAALLPNEGISIEDYLGSLTGERIQNILVNREDAYVNAKLPKFKSEYAKELNDVLKSLGMEDMFTENADLSGISDIPLVVDNVLHKTFINVNETGTEAAAATMIGVKEMCALPEEKPVYEVTLDRPFLYMIVDMEGLIPVFIGTVSSIG